MTGPDVPEGVDVERANVARMYDYWLGGAHNFAVDRVHADRIEASNRTARHAARSNRAFLRHVVRWCVARGIDQFLDLGSGVPTVGNVHEIAGDARVAYVDHEAVAVAHSRSILVDVDRATITQADLADADAVLGAPGVADLLDFSRPVAVLAVAVLHYVPGDLTALLAPYRDRLVSGGALAISHVSDEQDDPDLSARVRAAAEVFRSSADPVTLRSRAELASPFDGLAVAEPGMVDVVDWPDARPGVEKVGMYGVCAARA
ncbi:SAM-dependent methyltransferase [Actinomycetospora soli]|uniref:SAM-dependent methyltransferase n=1 Tax=Actinomycetospora soli TaxID=2893887 RepID=UPI001E58F426|nr:SAM-dependent methyltransferase [Actinomycetospora soli]MCD2190724.1 SAM-dependent methyltransferase [Actinomycetospora soli]